MLSTDGTTDWTFGGRLGSGVRAPVAEELLCLAIIRVTDLIVARAWHDGYPHRVACQDDGCVMRRFQRWRNAHGEDLGLVIAWRRDVMFERLPSPRRKVERGRNRLVVLLCEGTPLWEIEYRPPTAWGLVWGHLDRFAKEIGLDPAAEMASVRRVMAVSLACLLDPP